MMIRCCHFADGAMAPRRRRCYDIRFFLPARAAADAALLLLCDDTPVCLRAPPFATLLRAFTLRAIRHAIR